MVGDQGKKEGEREKKLLSLPRLSHPLLFLSPPKVTEKDIGRSPLDQNFGADGSTISWCRMDRDMSNGLVPFHS